MLTAEECPGCVQLMGLFVHFHTSVLGTKSQLVKGRNKAKKEQTWRCLYLGQVVVSGGRVGSLPPFLGPCFSYHV